MGKVWLKLIGTSERPLQTSYARPHVDSRKRPRRIRPGDFMFLYAVGGSKRVFALAQVSSEVYESDDADWPYRMNISYLFNLPVSSGVHIEEISAERNLVRSIRQASYIELSPGESALATSKLHEAFKLADSDETKSRDGSP